MLTSDYCGSFDGTILHYQVNRRVKNPTLLFIHGAGSNHTAWSRILPRFADRSYIAVDIRNHGLSGFGRFSIEAVTRDIAEILHRENVREFIPVGMSIGAPIALELAKRFPKKAKKAVLISPFSRSLTRASGFLIEAMRTLRGLLAFVPMRRRLKLVTHERLVPAVLSPFNELKGVHTRDYARTIERALGSELDFGAVKQPTLLITGTKDVFLRRRALADLLWRHPNIVHADVPTHHLVVTRQPLRTAGLIAAFAGE
ncbi:alpha/beta hydrolase [Candidatus Woesearchaeota archaeon]|nr:alpha/beta hydrolase [Candidatus Woesearchaeota archaeon]